MAIINSIAIGKASGKLGNIILQSYKGKTFARQRNETITTPPSPAQIDQQNKMFNCVRAMSFLMPFLIYFKARNQGTLSTYSYFVQLTSQFFTQFRALRGFQGLRQLAGLSFGNPNLLQITSIELIETLGVKTGVRVNFNTQIAQWEDNVEMYILCQNIFMSGGTYPINSIVTRSVTLTSQNWEDSRVDIEIEDFDTQNVVAYTRQYYSYSDNILFSEIFP